jgi:hypothetical protein
MEQVLAPRFDFTPKKPTSGPVAGFDYGDGGYDPDKPNVGVNPETGQIQIEIKGLAEPKSEEAQRIVKDDLNDLVAAFTQDTRTVERGIFDSEVVPEELTQVAMGKIVATKYPDLPDDDQEAIRQHAVAAVNMTQQVKKAMNEQGQSGSADTGNNESKANTAFVDGIRQFVMDVTSLDVDFIDRINPFGEAYAILAKSMSEESLRQFGNIIAGKKAKFTLEEAKELAVRALKFKKERGRLPEVTSNDPWEKRIAEGMNAYAQMVAEAKQNG